MRKQYTLLVLALFAALCCSRLAAAPNQAAFYEEKKRACLDDYTRIQEQVRSGLWDISTAGTWTECDTNLSSGESIVRSILLAKRFIQREFGVEPKMVWHPGGFGQAWTLPQILAKSGIERYCFSQGQGQPVFQWQSPDGSRVLACKCGKDALESSLAVSHFDKASKSRLLIVATELNLVAQGRYTSRAEIKRYNRECENSLASAEVLASIGSFYGPAYPAEEFGASWRRTCSNQFHDIIGGTATGVSYVQAKQFRDEVLGQTGSAAQAGLTALASAIDTRGPGIPIVVFNPLSWKRTDYVSVVSPFAGQATAVKITDASGRVCAGRSLGNRLTFTARDVPAMGYKMFWVNRVSKPFGSNVIVNGSVVENQFFRVRVDQNKGVITGIYDKVNRRSVMAPGQLSSLLQILLEDSNGMSARTLGQIKGKQSLLDESELVKIDVGPAKVTLQFDHRYGRSIFTQELTLYDAVPRIDIKLAADWRESWVKDKTTPMLKIAFPTNLKNPKATFEIPYGSIERPRNGAEVVGQKWADLSDPDYGVSILNDCKYGFDASGSTLRMSLIRSPHKPDPQSDIGMHEMTFSIYPHKGDWRAAGTVQRGYELNQPLVALVTKGHEGWLPTAKSFLSVSAPNLVVTALKQAEDGDGLIVRLYETTGEPSQGKIRTPLPCASWVETDLMENPIGQTRPITNGEFPISAGKYEIKTYKLLKQ